DGPHDIAHLRNRIARDRGDVLQKLRRLVTMRHLAEDGDLRQVGADVVVQVGGDMGANVGDGQQLAHPVPVEECGERDESGGDESHKPPSLPDWRQYSEIDGGDVGADLAVGVDAADFKAQPAGRQGGVVDGELFARLAPVVVGAD